MEKIYLKEKRLKKKRAMKGVYIIVVFGIVFTFIMIKFATSGGISDIFSFSKMPNADDAYKIAKEFVMPTIRSGNASFPESGYQYGKKSDSVYLIKSYVIAIDYKGEKKRTNFEMILKYEGGPKFLKKNWTMVDINVSSE